PAWGTTTGDVSLQTRPHSGHGLSIVTEEQAPATASADCQSVGGAVSRGNRNAARVGRSPLHRGRVGGASHSLLAEGRAESQSALGLYRSDRSPHQGVGVTQGAAGHACT